MKTLDEMIAVMQAAKDGKIIQKRNVLDARTDFWVNCDQHKPNWNWPDWDYRVKPERKRVPRTVDDLPKGGVLWVRDKDNYMIAVSTIDKSGICWPVKYGNPGSELNRGVRLFQDESNIQISADRVNWLPWWKEVEE